MDVKLTYLFLLLSFPTTAISSQSSCGVDFTYTSTIPWDYTSCLPSSCNRTFCCQTLLSLLGIGLSLRFRSTSLFRLPDTMTSAACLSEFQSNLTSYLPLLPPTLVSDCYPSPDRFVISNHSCAGIVTRRDWAYHLRNNTELDEACRPNMTYAACQHCYDTANTIVTELIRIDGNTSNSVNCFYFAVIYAGAVNLAGPTDLETANCIYGLPLLSSPDYPSISSSKRKNTIFLSIGIAATVTVVVSMVSLYLWWRRRQEAEAEIPQWIPVGGDQSDRPNMGPIWYDIEDLKKATGNFSDKNLIGRGSSGVVYKGVLADGRIVAVKCITGSEFDDEADFRNEATILGNIRHRNLVPLCGSCVIHGDASTQWYLVYDYMPNGNLHDHLFKTTATATPLNWLQRKGIILDVARGLVYLHYGVKPSIFHRDVKPTNILLDEAMHARVADFGLARQSRNSTSNMMTTRVAGTHGYLAPEYALYGQLTERSDVYSFGVVVLEVMSGRKALDVREDADPMLITDWAWTLVKAGRAGEVVEGTLREDRRNPARVMERFVQVGIMCSHVMVALRPTIVEALKMLEGDMVVPPVPDRPQLVGYRFTDGYTFGMSQETSHSLVEADAR